MIKKIKTAYFSCLYHFSIIKII